MASNRALSGLDPLRDLLGDVIGRLEVLESKVGVTAPGTGVPKSPVPVKANLVAAGAVPAVKAYDDYVKTCLVPLAQTCDDLGGLKNIGDLLKDAWEGVRTVIVLASRSKLPSEDVAVALTPHLAATQEAVKNIRGLRLDRDWDRHQKALVEMLACLSWVLMRAPKTLPVPMVKETLASAEFWSNRIRKDFKGKDDKQIDFCNHIKSVISGLAAYVEEHHKTGLAFNPRGVSLAEAAIRLSDEPDAAAEPDNKAALKSPVQKRHPTLGTNVVAGGNMAGLMGELAKRKSAEGDSAATGLKHVTKDQQTWRKEFKGGAAPTGLPSAPPLGSEKKEAAAAPKKKTPLRGLPIFEYQDRGFKWVVENHTKESATKEVSTDGVITVNISDPKQQVYLYNSDGITVKVVGKFKSLVLDKCTSCSVIFETLISSTELVNCKKIQLQVDGVCPVFTIDKTNNVLVWLSKESLDVSTFTTSLSSEMNVSFPDGDDQKEVPIPEQFVHKIAKGAVTSDVSDLYH